MMKPFIIILVGLAVIALLGFLGEGPDQQISDVDVTELEELSDQDLQAIVQGNEPVVGQAFGSKKFNTKEVKLVAFQILEERQAQQALPFRLNSITIRSLDDEN